MGELEVRNEVMTQNIAPNEKTKVEKQKMKLRNIEKNE